MTYLLGEIFIYIFLAIAFGFWLGWMAQNLVKRRTLSYHNRLWKANFLSRSDKVKPPPE